MRWPRTPVAAAAAGSSRKSSSSKVSFRSSTTRPSSNNRNSAPNSNDAPDHPRRRSAWTASVVADSLRAAHRQNRVAGAERTLAASSEADQHYGDQPYAGGRG